MYLGKYLKQILGKRISRNDSTSFERESDETLGAIKQSLGAKKKQDQIFWLMMLVAFIFLFIWRYHASNSQSSNEEQVRNDHMNIEVASKALDVGKMWRNYFEDKIVDQASKMQVKLDLVEKSINAQQEDYQNSLKEEVEKLKNQIKYLAEEQAQSRQALDTARSQINLQQEKTQSQRDYPQATVNLSVNKLGREEQFDHPKSNKNYFPETAYVKGILLGGIAVSTSIGSSSDPVPVIIRITGPGNLSKDFSIDLKKCHILGSSYGDLSSERAIVRAEVLSCQAEGLIYTTKVAGIIFGDDGMNGIKGKVVSTSNKHLKNVAIGSMLSGLSQSLKGQDSYNITGLGAVSTKSKGAAELLQSGGLSGISNAGEKIAEYYIKQAESMSPVLLISGGTKVDVVFTKGVYLNSVDVKEKIAEARNK